MRPVVLKTLSGAGALLLSWGVFVAAGAQTGSTPTRVETNGPDLRTIRLKDDDVYYCFDETLEKDDVPDDGRGFHLSGYDDDATMEADDSALDPKNASCVIAEFDDDLDPYQTSVGYAATDTVEELDGGSGNALLSAPVGDTTKAPPAGSTVGPDLRDFEVDEALDEVTFEFDEDLPGMSKFNYKASDFGVNQENGDEYTGDSLDVDDDEVIVQFSEDLDQDTVRAFVEREAVASRETDRDHENFGPARAEGEDTDWLELEDVDRLSPDTFRFQFDDDVQRSTADDEPEKFLLYGEDGTEYEGDEADGTRDGVEVRFDDVAELADWELPLATVRKGAVTEDNGSDPNTLSSRELAPSHDLPGYTDAPDLLSATFEGTHTTLVFDERVSVATGGHIFYLSLSGAPTSAQVLGGAAAEETAVNSSEMRIAAPLDASLVSGVLLTRGAVEDFANNINVVNSVGLTIGASPGPSESSIEPSVSPAPTPLCERPGVILGTDASDVLVGTEGPDVICAGNGDDFVRALGGADRVVLGDGRDVAEGAGGNDRIHGGPGDDILRGGLGNDLLVGGEGVDSLLGQLGRDRCRDQDPGTEIRSCERG